jgi:hypothetical protein
MGKARLAIMRELSVSIAPSPIAMTMPYPAFILRSFINEQPKALFYAHTFRPPLPSFMC